MISSQTNQFPQNVNITWQWLINYNSMTFTCYWPDDPEINDAAMTLKNIILRKASSGMVMPTRLSVSGQTPP